MMAQRYYICRRIGSGTSADPYNSELRAYLRETYPAAPHFLQQIIAHTCPWVLMKYDLDATTHAAVMTLTGIFAFPAGVLDRPVTDFTTAQRNAIRNKLEAAGFSFAWATNATTIRQILEYLAHTIQLSEWADIPIAAANFDTRKTVADVPVAARQRIAGHLADLGMDLSGFTLTTPLADIVAALQLRRFGSAARRWMFHDPEAD
jgi:hypothetical protein